MNRNQRAALANPNLEFGASTFLGQPVGPNQLLLVYEDRTEEEVSYLQKSLYFCHDGADFPRGETQMKWGIVMAVLPSNLEALLSTEEAFAACTNLKTIIGLENLSVIPTGFCAECSSLMFERLNASEIAASAFTQCKSLKRVELPNVITVGDGIFSGSVNLTVVLNDNAVNIHESAFNSVENLIYHGSLPGAPWGAAKWNGVPQN